VDVVRPCGRICLDVAPSARAPIGRQDPRRSRGPTPCVLGQRATRTNSLLDDIRDLHDHIRGGWIGDLHPNCRTCSAQAQARIAPVIRSDVRTNEGTALHVGPKRNHHGLPPHPLRKKAWPIAASTTCAVTAVKSGLKANVSPRRTSPVDTRHSDGALRKCGDGKHIRLCLFPRAELLPPYYLAILIHTAGNPEAIAELTCDCLPPIPLLDERELLVWTKSSRWHAAATLLPLGAIL